VKYFPESEEEEGENGEGSDPERSAEGSRKGHGEDREDHEGSQARAVLRAVALSLPIIYDDNEGME
jgi:hypothetical protein